MMESVNFTVIPLTSQKLSDIMKLDEIIFLMYFLKLRSYCGTIIDLNNVLHWLLITLFRDLSRLEEPRILPTTSKMFFFRDTYIVSNIKCTSLFNSTLNDFQINTISTFFLIKIDTRISIQNNWSLSYN